MKITELGLPGIRLIELDVHGDERGFFVETFNERRYAAAGFPSRFVQDNLARSRHGVLRGLHYQVRQPQGKLVWVLEGEVFDVAVDIDPTSESFGRHIAVTLNAENKHQLYVPQGYAHGYCVLSETAVFAYKCTAFHLPEAERGVLWNDPALGIRWPISEPIVNTRDQNWPLLGDLVESAPRSEPAPGNAVDAEPERQ
jgi:dTDP-4-dehydrorhamnose 3,5-epimerase